MFDFGWDEMAVIAVVALIALGPKELPQVMRTAGQWSRKLKLMAREFQTHVDDMVREAEISEMTEAARKAATFDGQALVSDTLDPAGELEAAFHKASFVAPEDKPDVVSPIVATALPVDVAVPVKEIETVEALQDIEAVVIAPSATVKGI